MSHVEDIQFLTVAEIAAAARFSRMTVYRAIHSGELPAKRLGRSFRVLREDALAYLRGRPAA